MAQTVSILVARLIFGAVFLMAATFKFLGMDATATYIAAAGFPMPLALAWIAAFFEVALVVAHGMLFVPFDPDDHGNGGASQALLIQDKRGGS